MPKFIIVDGYSLLFRSFFAMPYLSNSAGEPTGAVHGFATMLERLISEEKPDAMIVAWDAPGGTFRGETYEAYKANRPSAPDEFISQIVPAHEVVTAMGIKPLELVGFEADDCIGTAVVRARDEGYDVLVVSGDTDLLQLIREGVKVMIPKRGVTEVTIYDEAAVEERYGVRPSQFVDYKALKGDTSDNIPGVKGIGEKTAATLIREWDTIRNLYEHIERVKPDRIRNLLIAGKDLAELSYDLSRIRCDAPCEIDPDGYDLSPPDIDTIRDLFNRLEFRSLLARIEERSRGMSSTPGGQAAAKTSLWDEEEASGLREIAEADLMGAIDSMRGEEPVGVTAVLIGSHPLHTRLEGMAWADAGEITGCRFDENGDLPESLIAWLADPSNRVAVHDAKPIHRLLLEKGRSFSSLAIDTMIAGYLLHSGRLAPTLDALAVDSLGRNLPAMPSGGSRGSAGAWDPSRKERIEAETRAVRDLGPALKERLQADGLWDLYTDVEAPLIPILAAMERCGVLLEPEALREISRRLSIRIEELEEKVCEQAGERFNIGSPKQLQVILFEKLGLPRGKKIKTGYSTGVDTLEELAIVYPIVRDILDWREVSKLRSTYTDALLRLMDPDTCRIHTTFNQAVAATGRLSSTEPNLQNIPIRTDVGREIRRAFVAPSGHHLLSADYSQIELRVLAHFSEEPVLIEAFRRNDDIHVATASLIFGVAGDRVTSEMRRRAKTVNFAVLYGQSDFGLSRELGIPVMEARDFIRRYFERFPGIRATLDQILDQARRLGYVATLTGRRRYFPDIHSPNRTMRQFAERAAINSPLQGTAADIIKTAMIRVARRMDRDRLPARMLLQVHDELLFETPDHAIEETARVVREEMEQAFPLKVPVRVDVRVGCDWKDMTPVPPPIG